MNVWGATTAGNSFPKQECYRKQRLLSEVRCPKTYSGNRIVRLMFYIPVGKSIILQILNISYYHISFILRVYRTICPLSIWTSISRSVMICLCLYNIVSISRLVFIYPSICLFFFLSFYLPIKLTVCLCVIYLLDTETDAPGHGVRLNESSKWRAVALLRDFFQFVGSFEHLELAFQTPEKKKSHPKMKLWKIDK